MNKTALGRLANKLKEKQLVNRLVEEDGGHEKDEDEAKVKWLELDKVASLETAQIYSTMWNLEKCPGLWEMVGKVEELILWR